MIICKLHFLSSTMDSTSFFRITCSSYNPKKLLLQTVISMFIRAHTVSCHTGSSSVLYNMLFQLDYQKVEPKGNFQPRDACRNNICDRFKTYCYNMICLKDQNIILEEVGLTANSVYIHIHFTESMFTQSYSDLFKEFQSHSP